MTGLMRLPNHDMTFMNKTESSKFAEVVHSEIIGGDESIGQLFYEGRPQGGRFYGNDEQIREQAKSYISALKVHLASEYQRLYPTGLELRIWD